MSYFLDYGICDSISAVEFINNRENIGEGIAFIAAKHYICN